MRIEDQFIKCVCFVGYQLADKSFRMAGSAFLLSKSAEDAYLITARHVIDGIRNLGLDKVWLRVNIKDGSSQWIDSEANDWFTHPEDQSIDAAILHFKFSPTFDHLMLAGWGISDEKLKEKGVGIGDAVFITGLFRHHHGALRNIPIARHGNIACMNEEKVTTKFGKLDAYLIEVRSIGGLSGSPVFLNLGPAKTEDGRNYNEIHLLGLIHGHFDLREDSLDTMVEDQISAPRTVNVNTGIAVVVPYENISALIKIHKALDFAKSELFIDELSKMQLPVQ